MDGSRFPTGLGLSRRRLRPEGRPGRRSRLSRIRVRLPGAGATTLHVLSFERESARPRVVAFDRPLTLARWCEENGERHALVGGFFVRPEYAPLGELRLAGAPHPSIPFDPPWNRTRACVHIDEGALHIARRDRLAPEPPGDLLQAGPLLVAGGRRTVSDGEDPEGFSAGAHQFDSDITAGRYPRAALAVTRERLLAVACDGRTRRDAGMTLPELAEALIALGAEAAINLDGGGSASLVHHGRLRNRPRETHGMDLLGGRPVVTAIVFAPD